MARKWEEHSDLADDVMMAEESKKVYPEILQQQKKWLLTKNKNYEGLDEDKIRRHLQHVDPEEEKLNFI